MEAPRMHKTFCRGLQLVLLAYVLGSSFSCQAQNSGAAGTLVQSSSMAQQATANSENEFESSLLRTVEQGQHMMRDLEELCDGIGPRMTGSRELRRAQAWAMTKFQRYGADHVAEEAYSFGPSWVRGQSSARLLNANQQQLAIVQKAWTSSSVKAIRAPLEVLEAATLEAFRQALPRLRGKVVLALKLPSPSREQAAKPDTYSSEYNALIKQAKMAGMLMVSQRDGSLLDMSGSPQARYKENVGIISQEHAKLLQRLLARGIVPELEIRFGGRLVQAGKAAAAQQTQAYNVVAEIRGTEMPDEAVIIGVHQDSWDLATGATDNGVGVVLAMEVLRALRASQVPIKRSLRVVLFSGEEQGLLGSKAYVQQHASELGKIQAMLTMDSGAGRIIGFPDMQVDAWYAGLTQAFSQSASLKSLDLAYAISNGSDHMSFYERGVPAFSAMQEPMDYLSHTWHSNVDTIDHVRPEYLVYNAKILSALSLVLLNGPKLPHVQK